MGVEFELKFQASPQVLKEICQEYPGDYRRYQMETTYYDTEAGALSARHYTLRRRMENGRSICTLKTPADCQARREFETECDAIEAAIPVLCKLGAPEDFFDLTKGGVTAVCGASFVRQALTLMLCDGEAELALDSGILSGGSRQIPLCEVEVEAKTCSREAAAEFAGILMARFDLQLENKSKFARARALYMGEQL